MQEFPNLREALVLVSGFFVLFCLVVIGYTTWSKRVQNNLYHFTVGQWASLVGMLMFSFVFTFGYSLPVPAHPPEAPKTLAQIRSDNFRNLFTQCMGGSGEMNRRTDCTYVARIQADVAIGVSPLPIKVVRQHIVETVVKDNDHDRYSLYSDYFIKCKEALPDGAKTPQQLDYCALLADRQTDTSLGVKHVPEVITQQRIEYRPTPYLDLFRACVGDWSTDKSPDPVAARNDRIKLCHQQAEDAVAHHM